MCIFKQIILSPRHNLFYNLHYIPDIQACYKKYAKFLEDDFSSFENNIIPYILNCSPFIWAIVNTNGTFMGFVSLDNFVGNNKTTYSAELTTCFEKRAWGKFTQYCANFFLKKCFDEFGLYKISAKVFPDNFRISTLLKKAGFQYETTLKSETLRFGKPQDIKLYAIYKTHYYKNKGDKYNEE